MYLASDTFRLSALLTGVSPQHLSHLALLFPFLLIDPPLQLDHRLPEDEVFVCFVHYCTFHTRSSASYGVGTRE